MAAQIGSKRAIPIKTEPKCKFCRSEHREHIDQLLLARSLREKDPATGQFINLQYVLDALTAIGVENPTEENCKTHWRKHVEVVDAEVADEMDEEVRSLYDELIAEMPDSITPATSAEWIAKAFFARERVRLRNGGEPSVTTDQFLAALKVIQAEKQNHETRQLLGGIAGAIGGAMMKKLSEGKRDQLPPAPVIEGVEAEFAELPDA